jgi:hypothetical protein
VSVDLASALFEPGDERPWAPAKVLAIDSTNARLTVDLDGSAVTLRRIAAPYRVGDVVAVVRDPARSGAGEVVAGVISLPAPLWRPGVVTAIDAPNSRLTVTVDDATMVLPHMAAAYTVAGNVAVLLDPASTFGGIVLGPLGNPPATPAAPAPPTTPIAPTVATFQALILPTWSGSWSARVPAYDRWNTSRYGGPSSLYQGNQYGSGPMTGIAVYGDQVAGLGALSITAMTVASTIATGSGSPVFQGCAQGTPYPGAPAPSGATASGVGQVDLVASGIAEAMRTSAIKGICTVGGTYLAVRGTSLADGMALSLTYTKAV